ncbi:hypothetical protein [Rubrivivax rivuli]|uniref:Uncharacterized protein n=1 Tax=Rubrivivax rivuli TaxID=1862385 RepID=A0A437RAT9_9BURK|nr:hypothetical protein [Rubrivivax rivuli]RVU43901.1 hypothetical protein EOE66_19805 [Rubrivivax rivuli]
MAQAPGPTPALAGLRLPVGFVLYSDGQALAALSLFGAGQGRVWMNPQAEPDLRQAAAALLSVLLLRDGA